MPASIHLRPPGSTEGAPDQRGGHRRGHPLRGGAPGGPRREPEPRGPEEPPGGANEHEGAVRRPEGLGEHVAVGAGHRHQRHGPAEHSEGEQRRGYCVIVYLEMFFELTLPFSFASPSLQAKAVEDLQDAQGQIDSLLSELSSLSQPGGRDVTDTPSSQPEGAVTSHTEALQVWILCPSAARV